MSHPSILVVDDSVTIQKVFELAFESEDLDLTVVGDTASALEAAHERTPQLVITDINMPDGDGFTLCRTLKSEPAFAETPIFLLGSALDDFDEEAARRAGADGKFEKPFRSEEMVARVKEVIARKGPVAKPVPEEEFPEPEETFTDFDDDTFDEIDIPLESLLDSMGGGEVEDEPAPLAEEPLIDEPIDELADEPDDAPVLLDLKPQAVADDEDEEDDLLEAVVEDDLVEDGFAEDGLDDDGVDDDPPAEEHDFTPTTPIDELGDDEGELSEEAIRLLDAIDEAAGLSSEESHNERVGETVTEEIAPNVAAMSQEALSAAVEMAVSRAVEGMISRDVVEKAVGRAVNSLLADMREEMLDVFKKIAADVTLNVAEDLVRQTIEQIKSDATADQPGE